MTTMEELADYMHSLTDVQRRELDELAKKSLEELTDLYRQAETAPRKQFIKTALMIRVLNAVIEESCADLDGEISL